MHPSVEELLAVQKVDSATRFLREGMRLRPLELEDDRKKVAASRAMVEATEAEMKALRQEADRGELDIKTSDQEIGRLNVALNSAKTNQEYAVLREQIQRQAEARSKREEEVLEHLGRIDQLGEERDQLKRELEENEKIYRRREEEVAEVIRGLEKQVEELTRQREALVEDVDPQHLSLYQRILDRHGNFAISAVKDSICQGCFMTVTAQNVSLLMLGRELVQCRNCSRILYLE
jgi:predicted  nucleic acid-binding Zn-ribbon protein